MLKSKTPGFASYIASECFTCLKLEKKTEFYLGKPWFSCVSWHFEKRGRWGPGYVSMLPMDAWAANSTQISARLLGCGKVVGVKSVFFFLKKKKVFTLVLLELFESFFSVVFNGFALFFGVVVEVLLWFSLVLLWFFGRLVFVFSGFQANRYLFGNDK